MRPTARDKWRQGPNKRSATKTAQTSLSAFRLLLWLSSQIPLCKLSSRHMHTHTCILLQANKQIDKQMHTQTNMQPTSQPANHPSQPSGATPMIDSHVFIISEHVTEPQHYLFLFLDPPNHPKQLKKFKKPFWEIVLLRDVIISKQHGNQNENVCRKLLDVGLMESWKY